MKKTFIQENLLEMEMTCEESVVFEPRHISLHLLFSSTRWKRHSKLVAKNLGLPLSVSSSQRLIFPGGAGHQHFSSCPPAPCCYGLAEDKHSGEVEVLSFCPTPTRGAECSIPENHGTLTAFTPHHGVGISDREKQALETSSCYYPIH